MARANDHLRREILGRAAEGIGLFPALLHDLGKAEVGEHDVAIIVEQDILRLQVSVDDVAGVEIADCEGDLRGIKFGFLLRKSLLL